MIAIADHARTVGVRTDKAVDKRWLHDTNERTAMEIATRFLVGGMKYARHDEAIPTKYLKPCTATVVTRIDEDRVFFDFYDEVTPWAPGPHPRRGNLDPAARIGTADAGTLEEIAARLEPSPGTVRYEWVAWVETDTWNISLRRDRIPGETRDQILAELRRRISRSQEVEQAADRQHPADPERPGDADGPQKVDLDTVTAELLDTLREGGAERVNVIRLKGRKEARFYGRLMGSALQTPRLLDRLKRGTLVVWAIVVEGRVFIAGADVGTDGRLRQFQTVFGAGNRQTRLSWWIQQHFAGALAKANGV